MTSHLTAEEIRAILDYNPLTGIFHWKRRAEHNRHDKQWNTNYSGKVAGTTNDLYVKISVNGKRHYAHHLAWLYVHGVPCGRLDHRDLNKHNNAINNLREATAQENSRNRAAYSSSGQKNVYWHKGKWRVVFTIDKKFYCGGRYGELDDAVSAAALMRAELHGEFERR